MGRQPTAALSYNRSLDLLAAWIGCGTVRRIRTAPTQHTNNWPKRTLPMSTGLQAIDSEILMKSCSTWWAGGPTTEHLLLSAYPGKAALERSAPFADT